MEDLLRQVEQTLIETNTYVQTQQTQRALAETATKELQQQLQQQQNENRNSNSTINNEVATLRARLIASESTSIQLQKDLIQEKEESATELTLAVDKAVLETMEHELITRETKINEAVALLRKVEFKSKNQQHNHTATATSNLKVLQLKYDRKEKELDRRQSIIKQKDQELKMLKEALTTTNVQNEKDTLSFRKQSVRKENVLKEQINELKTKLEANSEIHLQLDQSKRELR